MGTSEIIRELEREARAEAAAIQRQSEKQQAEIVAKAEAEAAAIVESSKSRTEAEAERIANSAVFASLEARRITGNARMEVYRGVLGEVGKMLSALPRDKKKYEEYLRKSAAAGKAAVGGDFVITCNRRDAAIAKKFGPVSQKSIETAGGLVVASPDGKVRADGTFEALLAQNEESLLVCAAENLKGR